MKIVINKEGIIQHLIKDSELMISWLDDCSYKLNDIISIYIKNSQLISIELPAYYGGDLFFSELNNRYIITDNLFLLCKELGKASLNVDVINYFYRKGYCPLGKTFFNEIKRCTPFSRYLVQDGKFVCLSLINRNTEPFDINNDEENYMLFKKCLNQSIDIFFRKENENIVLLSGGVDSRLIYTLLYERLGDVKAITGLVKPFNELNCADVLRAENVAKSIGKEISVMTNDYGESSLEELDEYIYRMPLTSHGCLDYKALFNGLNKNNNVTVWCGQNMDTLYNLGPTERTTLSFHGIAQWFKRFYLSEDYINNLINDKNKLTTDIVAWIGLILFKLVTKDNSLALPKNAQELVTNFSCNSDYTIFRYSGYDYSILNELNYNFNDAFEVKRTLYQHKLAFLKGGDSQSIEVSGHIFQKQVVFPYSTSIMVDYFDKTRLTYRDVCCPKRFSYRYMNELADKYGQELKDFSKPKSKEINNRFNKVLGLYDAYEKIVDDTRFGKQLKSEVGKDLFSYSGLKNFEDMLKIYWVKKVITMLKKDYQVEIIGE